MQHAHDASASHAMTQRALPASPGATVRLQLRSPTMDDPWQWLSAGWQDMSRNPVLSLAYGAAFVAIGLLVTVGLWMLGLESAAPALAGGFTLVGPVFAIGLYEISRKYEAGQKPQLRDLLQVRLPAPAQMALLAFMLMFLFLVWIRLATLNYALFSYGDYRPLAEFVSFALGTTQGLTMLVVGTAIGAAVALVAFSISVIAVPILMRHDVDVLTAIGLSVSLVLRNPGPMLLWAWLIAILCAMGLATLFVGLVIVFPLVGHATWHAYRSVVVVD
jgi:uncharacterized membrane protein